MSILVGRDTRLLVQGITGREGEFHSRAMLEYGRWEATATGEPGIRSYHLNELASKFSTMESVARQFDAAPNSRIAAR